MNRYRECNGVSLTSVGEYVWFDKQGVLAFSSFRFHQTPDTRGITGLKIYQNKCYHPHTSHCLNFEGARFQTVVLDPLTAFSVLN